MPDAPISRTPQVFTLDQVAGPVLPCNERFVADKLRAGLWPGRKVGRKWVLTEDDLREIVRICVVNPTAPPADTANTQASPGISSMTRTTARRMRNAGGDDAAR